MEKDVWYDDFGQRYEGSSHPIDALFFDVEHPEAIQKAIDNKSLKKLKPVQPQAAPAQAAPAKAAPAKKS